MLNKIAFTVLMLFVVINSFSQEEIMFANNLDDTFQAQELTQYQKTTQDYTKYWGFGGNIGLSFWNGGADILVGPKAYYHISPKFLTGFGVTYIYSEYKNNVYSYHANSFGGSILLAVRPIPYIQISTEYEGLQTNYSGYYSDEYFVNALYLGLSYVSDPVSFGIRYDVLYDTNKSVYSSAWNPIVGFYF